MTFKTDEMSLRMLIEACGINPDTGRSHVHDFLDMGSRIKSETDITHEFESGGIPVIEVEYEEGYGPSSVNDVLVALANEVLSLREQLARGS